MDHPRGRVGVSGSGLNGLDRLPRPSCASDVPAASGPAIGGGGRLVRWNLLLNHGGRVARRRLLIAGVAVAVELALTFRWMGPPHGAARHGDGQDRYFHWRIFLLLVGERRGL